MSISDTPSENAFGKKLHDLRLRHCAKQVVLATECNYTPAYICELERGARLPTAETVARLSNALASSGATSFELDELQHVARKVLLERHEIEFWQTIKSIRSSAGGSVNAPIETS